jgi:hypothetical protein
MGVNLFVQMYSVQTRCILTFEQDRLIIFGLFSPVPAEVDPAEVVDNTR